MYQMQAQNEVEIGIINRALTVYRNKLVTQKQNIELMKAKKFNYGDIVVKKGTSHFDSVFGTGDGEIGVIVGHFDIDGIDTTKSPYSKEVDMYRIHYNNSNNYVGVNGDSIELYKGETPKHLIDVEINKIKYIEFYL